MVVLDLLMIAYTYWLFARAGVPSGVRNAAAAGLVGLLLPLYLLFAPTGAMPVAMSGPLFLTIVVAYVGVAGSIMLGVPAIRNAMLSLDHVALLLPQGIRVFFGAGFLMQAATGDLPTTFGILDGFTHITAGFLGLLAASMVAVQPAKRGAAWLANLFGLADILVVASTLALVLLPTITPRHSMMFAVFLPAPIWAWLHVLSIAKLVRGEAHGESSTHVALPSSAR
ncbi:MAG: hypothetical protein R3B72_38925 [Polyangiaceae bacterium]